jgi:hypothetical protein
MEVPFVAEDITALALENQGADVLGSMEQQRIADSLLDDSNLEQVYSRSGQLLWSKSGSTGETAGDEADSGAESGAAPEDPQDELDLLEAEQEKVWPLEVLVKFASSRYGYTEEEVAGDERLQAALQDRLNGEVQGRRGQEPQAATPEITPAQIQQVHDALDQAVEQYELVDAQAADQFAVGICAGTDSDPAKIAQPLGQFFSKVTLSNLIALESGQPLGPASDYTSMLTKNGFYGVFGADARTMPASPQEFTDGTNFFTRNVIQSFLDHPKGWDADVREVNTLEMSEEFCDWWASIHGLRNTLRGQAALDEAEKYIRYIQRTGQRTEQARATLPQPRQSRSTAKAQSSQDDSWESDWAEGVRLYQQAHGSL